MIDTLDAKILWHNDDQRRTVKVRVMNARESETADDRRFESSHGCIVKGWPYEDGNDGPEGLFGQMLAHNFISPHAMKQALDEFSKIDQCDWARRMLRGIEAAGG